MNEKMNDNEWLAGLLLIWESILKLCMQFLVQVFNILTIFLNSQITGWKEEKTMGKQIYNSSYLSYMSLIPK